MAGSARPSHPGPGISPVGPPVPPHIGMPYRPTDVTPPPVMRIQSPQPPTAASSAASALPVMLAGLFSG